MLKLFGVLPSILIVQIVSICWAEDSTVFHAAAPRLGVAKGPAPTSLILTKTVGTDPNICASTNTLQALVGQKIYYCFDIENVSSLTFDLHTLTDSEVGAILTDFPYALAPSSRVFVTAEQTIYESVIGTATWSAVDMDTATTASSIASTTVTVPPPVTLRKTVGTDPQICASTDEITVNSGTNVYYCFEITNNSQATFDIHTLVDSEVGPILTDFPYMLAPATSVFVTAEQTVGSSVVGTATWTVYEEVTGMPFTATATTTVHVPTPTPTPTLSPTSTPTPSSTPTPTLEPRADLDVVQTDFPDPVAVGETILYSVQIRNFGPDKATGVTVEDRLPSSAMFISASPGCSHAGGLVSCEVDEIASGMTKSVTISVEVVSGLNLCNFIRVAGLEIDPEPSNNSSQNCTIGTAPTFHPADINEDLMIDANDLLELLKAWELEY